MKKGNGETPEKGLPTAEEVLSLMRRSAIPRLPDGMLEGQERRLMEVHRWAIEHGQTWYTDYMYKIARGFQAPGADHPVPAVPEPEVLIQVFGLTIAEAEVLHSFLNGGTLKAIAEERSVSINTVRTHFARIRAKLDAHDQAAIVRIALTGANGRAKESPPE